MRVGLPDVPTIPKWLSGVTPVSCRIGFDPSQIPFNTVTTIQRDLHQESPDAQRLLVPVPESNLIDLIWTDRPQRPNYPIRAVSVDDFAGDTWEAKLDRMRQRMREKNTTSVVIVQLDEIAWLFNLRGADISNNPVFFSYAVVTLEEVHLFVDWRRGEHSLDLPSHIQSPSHKVSVGFVSHLNFHIQGIEMKQIVITKDISLNLIVTRIIIVMVN